MTQERIVILGSTGSIGRQALDVVAANPDRFAVVGLVAGSDARALAAQASQHDGVPTGLGEDAAVDMARREDADIVLNAIVGAAGLKASIAALETGKTLALANKESLVAGGEVCSAAARDGGGTIVPVDSEHAALAQCLEGRDRSTIARIILTASGGPFRSRTDLSGVTVAEALAHPTWSMGPKITIDSATMMNKGFEIIEAHFLFDFDYDRIDVLIHPQSIVHALVELVDGSVLMQAAPTDMRIPIQAALAAPGRLRSAAVRLDLTRLDDLRFEQLDTGKFPAVELAYETGRRGSTYPAVMNAANEIAVQAFLDGHLPFAAVVPITREVVERHEGRDASILDEVLFADEWARAEARALVTRHPVSAGDVS